MRIGILTYWNSDNNYGQILQCYALQKYLRLHGHDVFLIRYFTPKVKDSILCKIRRNISIKRLIYHFSEQRKIDEKINKYENDLYLKNLELNKLRKFDEFRNNHIITSKKCYYSLAQLRTNPPAADIYICGSDQVWNNSLLNPETEVWYLGFGSNNVRRISYAASIGRLITNKETKKFKQYLQKFDAISVREKSSQCLCEDLGIKDVHVTLDPTLLLSADEYRKIEYSPKNSLKESFLFMYILNVTDKNEIYWDIISEYLRCCGSKLKIVYSSGYVQAREIIKNIKSLQATLPEWLYYIDNSLCVITTSFHGVVFSIKMHKPFIAILLNNKFSKGNDRIISLLNSIGLSDRILNPQIPIKDQIEKPIDWSVVDNNISKLQKESFDFLKINLS